MNLKSYLLAVAMALASLSTANAAMALFTYSPSVFFGDEERYSLPDLDFSQTQFMVGNTFTLDGTYLLTHLGVMDTVPEIAGRSALGTDGFSSPVHVGLWDADSNLLGEVDVLSTDSLTGGYRYHLLDAPITLLGGRTYTIGVLAGGPMETVLADLIGGDGVIVANSGVTLVSSDFDSSDTFTKPTAQPPESGATPDTFGPANAMITAIPEPSCALLGSIGLFAALGRRRRLPVC